MEAYLVYDVDKSRTVKFRKYLQKLKKFSIKKATDIFSPFTFK